MKLFGTLRLLVIIAVVTLVGAAAIWWARSPKASRVTTHDSAITDISLSLIHISEPTRL